MGTTTFPCELTLVHLSFFSYCCFSFSSSVSRYRSSFISRIMSWKTKNTRQRCKKPWKTSRFVEVTLFSLFLKTLYTSVAPPLSHKAKKKIYVYLLYLTEIVNFLSRDGREAQHERKQWFGRDPHYSRNNMTCLKAFQVFSLLMHNRYTSTLEQTLARCGRMY